MTARELTNYEALHGWGVVARYMDGPGRYRTGGTLDVNSLTPGQRDGTECVICWADLANGDPPLPVITVDGGQLFACATHEKHVPLISAERKLYDAYETRTSEVTTVDLSDDECAAVCEILDESINGVGRETNATPHLRTLLDKLSETPHPLVIEDYRSQAATVQGLDYMATLLDTEEIAHAVEDTGGATMLIRVPLPDASHIEIQRGDDWDGEYSSPDAWTLIRFETDELGAPFTDLGFNVTATEAINLIRTEHGKAGRN
ncbi:hypothetical protein [Actinomadura sp. 9N215]|uniref:hypothetical protein n=1 Tax=Actinomadura sp. 9N215 TaxID=3375150 RepID=UPI0037AB028E